MVVFLCKFCQKEFFGGISRIKSHLSGIRGRDIEICLQVPIDVKSAVLFFWYKGKFY